MIHGSLQHSDTCENDRDVFTQQWAVQQATTNQERKLALSLLHLINNERDARGLHDYQWNDVLADGATAHSQAMMEQQMMVQQLPGELDPDTRIRMKGFGADYLTGENIGRATDIKAIVQMVIDEGAAGRDYQNLFSIDFIQIGVGIVIDDQGQLWLTEDFIG